MSEASAAAIHWERRWAPYDETTYRAVLSQVQASDMVLEIGAGDFRLAYRLADKARHVLAIELNPALVSMAQSRPRPPNLSIILADAYRYPFPTGTTVGVLLMRHCRHFGIFADKLTAIACRRLITNARWGHHVEVIDLAAPRLHYSELAIGWYVCWCGATGFIPGPAKQLTPRLEQTIFEVKGCPLCSQRKIAP